MDFACQADCLSTLRLLAQDNRHSLLISGSSGSGKTYLAGQYADMLGIPDFQLVNPTVAAIRDSLDLCIQFDSPIVLCIENLDSGVAAASYALLKNLEEPQENLYIVVTCNNLRKVPSTITSRCVCVDINPPTQSDLTQYAEIKDMVKLQDIRSTRLWESIRSFQDIDTVFNMSDEEKSYVLAYPTILNTKDCVSSLQWALCHYPNNSELPLKLCLRYLLDSLDSQYLRRCCLRCLNDISGGRIAAHAAVALFVLEYKYGE